MRRPTPGNLLLPPGWAGRKCIEAALDPTFVAGRGGGRPVDFVLHATSAPCDEGVVAHAGVCAVGGYDGRPVAGAVNLCPGAFDKLPAHRQVEVVVHELLHAFVSGGAHARGGGGARLRGGAPAARCAARAARAFPRRATHTRAPASIAPPPRPPPPHRPPPPPPATPPHKGMSPTLFPLFPNGDPRANVAGPYGPSTMIRCAPAGAC